MSDIIFHHYPQSPVSEKVRVGFGIKDLAWRSVIIPRIPPKPDLMPLTGGYRRTPVMQLGADIYCDSQCILRELERRFPAPSFMAGGADGMVWGVSRWIDSELFCAAIKVVLGAAPDSLPPEFAQDRGRLYLGPQFDLATVHDDLPHVIAQLRGQLGWVEQRLAGGRPFILGAAPALPDLLAYYVVWFLRGRWVGGADLIAGYPALAAWEDRVMALGHGRPRETTAAAALAVARDAEPATAAAVDSDDSQALVLGQPVTVEPLGDGGDPAVAGRLQVLGRETVAVLRDDDRVGQVCIHFPRVGYRVAAVG